jgi:HEAT repeat protein
VRRAAIYGVLIADDQSLIPWLERVEKADKEWLVRSAATEAIETLRQNHKVVWAPPDLSRQRWLVEYAAHDGRTVPNGSGAVPFLMQVLSDATQPALRMAAAATISQLPAHDVLPALETAVHNDDKQVSEAAFTTLCAVRHAYDL